MSALTPGGRNAPHDRHAHEHDHAHPHPTEAEERETLSYYQVLEISVRELLMEKGVLTPDEIRAAIDRMDSRSPAQGARVVARAWVDPSFKARLLEDGSAGVRELGMDVGPTRLMVVENVPGLQNLIVCTLCSCYPRLLLGPPPDWYKSSSYRRRAVREPRAVLAEFGTKLPWDTEVRVHDSTAELRYLVLPERPPGTEAWTEERLAALVTRDSMVGVTVPSVASLAPLLSG